MTTHPLSLASGVLPEFTAEDVVGAAQASGYDAVGLMIDDRWTRDTTRRVRQLLNDHPLPVLDVEVVWIRPDDSGMKNHERLIDTGAELGASNVLIVSSDPDPERTKRAFERLCIRAAAGGMRAVLEFLMITEVKSLQAALDIVQSVDHPAGGILIDSLHLDRCGNSAADLAGLPPELFPYMQLCDGPAAPVGRDYQGYLTDAIDDRLAPGDGNLPLREQLDRFAADLPLSLEVRSRWYREHFPDATARAGEILRRTRAFLAAGDPA